MKMTFLRTAPAMLSVALLTAIAPFSVQADDFDKKTTVTFSAPVQIPGVHISGYGVLPAGTYVFKLLNSSSNRHIVQIFNPDQTMIYATILAIPNYRLTPTDKTVITFNEGLRGQPEALRAWFYPGAQWGEEFVYPKEKAVEIAKVTKLPVIAATADFKLEAAKPDDPAIVLQLTQLPVMAVRPTGELVELAQVVQITPAPVQVAAAPAPQAAQASQATTDESLPLTASPVPMIALCGVLALVSALGIRMSAKRV